MTQIRPLDALYPIVYPDCAGAVGVKAVYLALGGHNANPGLAATLTKQSDGRMPLQQ
jgi:hypothetical protein